MRRVHAVQDAATSCCASHDPPVRPRTAIEDDGFAARTFCRWTRPPQVGLVLLPTRSTPSAPSPDWDATVEASAGLGSAPTLIASAKSTTTNGGTRRLCTSSRVRRVSAPGENVRGRLRADVRLPTARRARVASAVPGRSQRVVRASCSTVPGQSKAGSRFRSALLREAGGIMAATSRHTIAGRCTDDGGCEFTTPRAAVAYAGVHYRRRSIVASADRKNRDAVAFSDLGLIAT